MKCFESFLLLFTLVSDDEHKKLQSHVLVSPGKTNSDIIFTSPVQMSLSQ